MQKKGRPFGRPILEEKRCAFVVQNVGLFVKRGVLAVALDKMISKLGLDDVGNFSGP